MASDHADEAPRADERRIQRPLSLVAQVEQILRKAIADGQYPDGRMPTAVELAEAFGVSRETVRRAAETLQAEGLIVKLRRKGTFVNTPGLANREAYALQGTLLAYLQARYKAPHGHDERATPTTCALMLQGAVEAAGEANIQLVVRSAPHTDLGKAFQALHRAHSIKGAIFASYGEEKLLSKATGLGLPIVLLDHDTHLPQISSVRDDSFAGARDAVAYLASLGHRRIACAHWHHGDLNPWRLKGYQQGLKEANIGRRSKWEISAELTESGAVQVVEQLLAITPRPTALFCFNNTLARLVLSELERRGIEVPGQLSLVGAGGEEVFGMTCVQADWYAMGREAVHLVLRGMTGDDGWVKHKLYPQTLHTGTTSGAPAVSNN